MARTTTQRHPRIRACSVCSTIAALAPEEVARLDALGEQALGPAGSLSQL